MSDVQTFKVGDRVVTTGVGQTRYYHYDRTEAGEEAPVTDWDDEGGRLNGPGAIGRVCGGPDEDGEYIIEWDRDNYDHSRYADPRTLGLAPVPTVATAPNAKASFVTEPVFPDVVLRLTYEEARTVKIAASTYPGLTAVRDALDSLLGNLK